ncbi:hypothetical protein XO10_01535 [Marinitoga sp. 1135]|uniref:hypothetical protein n=1 Tax=Marinitoga TaxID=160798 RepID=UPI00031BD4DB|nr:MULTISPECIES: hypothetical protein [Marinitoga]APT75214.1 hypothetical protein LN42_01505 [Marinitoga sp. 1137]NUU94996.1 hypothetical protein [Marinitoga sp. 1135]NUU96952.1 hypothetical protein [Marinitoga sp. 1138]
MKKVLLLISIFVVAITAFTINIAVMGTYGITASSTSIDIAGWDDTFKNFDYYTVRIGLLFPAEDSPEMSFGPYFGYTVYDNISQTQLKDLNAIIEDTGYEIGIITTYNTDFLFNTKFNVLAVGGMHTEDEFKTLSTIININLGLSYEFSNFNIMLLGGYESRYFSTDNKMATINYFPLNIALEVSF